MTKRKSKIGISSRIISADNYHEKRDAISHDWPQFLEKLESNMIIIPNTLTNVEAFLDEIGVEGIILSGGDNIGDDPERDKTENKIIDFTIKNKIPLFGVCRGMQIINKYFGGSIETDYQSKHVGKSHTIELTNPAFSSFLKTNSLTVNSFHKNIIKPSTLGKNLEPFAVVKNDKTIEGFFHKSLQIVGVMWHPERDPNFNNQLILRKVFHEKSFWKK